MVQYCVPSIVWMGRRSHVIFQRVCWRRSDDCSDWCERQLTAAAAAAAAALMRKTQ